MKKILSVLMIVACLCAVLVLPANAAADPMATTFQEQLLLLDYFYNFNAEYMIRVANDKFVSYDNMGPVTVSAAEYEKVLHDHFAIDDATLNSIRVFDEYALKYDAAAQTYTLCYTGGFGGMLPEREYLGYVQNGQTYDVYYRHLTYQYLSDVLPEGTTEHDLFGDSWPSSYEYEGLVYESGPDGYYAIKSRDNYGRKYTVEMNGDIVRILACVDYTEGQQPDSFDDKEVEEEVIYDIPAGGDISIPENDCFAGNTTVKVEPIVSGSTFQTVTQAMETVAEKYVAYEFTATRENVAVQPSGKLAVTFAIPAGYSDDVVVYYMAKDGVLEALKSTVDAKARTVTAELEHFSTYILADVASAEPAPTDPTDPIEPAPTEPKPTEPQPTEPQPTEPVPTEPQPTEPAPTDPVVPTNPVIPTDPVAPTDPAPTKPQPTEPSAEPTEPDNGPAAGGGDAASDPTGIIIAVIAVAVIALGVVAVIIIRKKK